MSIAEEIRKQQLGMPQGTAAAKLRQDLLFHFVRQAGISCFHCGGELTRDTFSIEHKIPWLHAENAKELFFDLKNISFSHHSCNMRAARKPTKKYFTTEEKYQADLLCQRKANAKYRAKMKAQKNNAPLVEQQTHCT